LGSALLKYDRINPLNYRGNRLGRYTGPQGRKFLLEGGDRDSRGYGSTINPSHSVSHKESLKGFVLYYSESVLILFPAQPNVGARSAAKHR
jgi:hypothetical protein